MVQRNRSALVDEASAAISDVADVATDILGAAVEVVDAAVEAVGAEVAEAATKGPRRTRCAAVRPMAQWIIGGLVIVGLVVAIAILASKIKRRGKDQQPDEALD